MLTWCRAGAVSLAAQWHVPLRYGYSRPPYPDLDLGAARCRIWQQGCFCQSPKGLGDVCVPSWVTSCPRPGMCQSQRGMWREI